MKRYLPVVVSTVVLVLLAGWAFRRITRPVSSQIVLQHEPLGIMGTQTNLVLVTDRERAEEAQEHLEAAESELRRLESLMSTWIDASQISRFNAAAANRPIVLDAELMDLLRSARELHSRTRGVFDISIRPLIELWRLAGAQGRLPSAEELSVARSESTWDQIEMGPDGLIKKQDTTRIDVDGIAKGFAIDRAHEVLELAGASGGMVEVGGDLRVFGQGPGGKPWIVAIRSPFENSVWAEIELSSGAVCSSGDYARYIEIDGRQFSHIIDPRTGRPTEETHAVTVVGPEAVTADAWATTLSILGVAGLDLLDAKSGLEAMVVTGGPEDYVVRASSGFPEMLVRAAFEIEQ